MLCSIQMLVKNWNVNLVNEASISSMQLWDILFKSKCSAYLDLTICQQKASPLSASRLVT